MAHYSAHGIRAPRAPRFDGYSLSMRIASQPIGRCSACDSLVYLRYDDDNARLIVEHQPGNLHCGNWDQLGELRLAKVLP